LHDPQNSAHRAGFSLRQPHFHRQGGTAAPFIQHRIQQRAAILEVPVKTALRGAQIHRQLFHAHLFHAAAHQHADRGIDPVRAAEALAAMVGLFGALLRAGLIHVAQIRGDFGQGPEPAFAIPA
jgi:hypothetical protein